MINADEYFYTKPDNAVVELITSTDSSQSDIWVLLPATVDGASDNYQKAQKMIRELRQLYLIDNVVPENLRACLKSKKGRVFTDELCQHLDQFIPEELAEISEEAEKQKPKVTAYHEKTTKEKFKWIAPKFGLLRNHNKSFLKENQIKTPNDLLTFAENSDNLTVLTRLIAEIEENNINPKAKEKMLAINRKTLYDLAIDRWLKKQFTLFNENIYFIVPSLKYQGIDTMIIVGHRESFMSDFAGPKQIVNRLGYRAESSKLVYALLNIYPALFVNEQETRLFWDVLMSVGHIKQLPESEQQKISELPKKLEEKFTDKKTRAQLAKIIDNLKKVNCAADHDIYKKVMMSMVARLTNRDTKENDSITRIIMHELIDHLFFSPSLLLEKMTFLSLKLSARSSR